MVETDRDLIDRALVGDRGAFSALIERHAAPVWTAVSRSLADRELAREVFQETWVRAWEGLTGLRNADRLRSWLLSIALNLTRQWLRKNEPEELDRTERTAPEDSPSERAELRAILQSAVADLPAQQRRVVELRIHFDRSYEEIARELGTTTDSARASFYQAMKRLRTRFDDEDLKG